MGSPLTSAVNNEPLLLMCFMIYNVTAKIHKKIKVFATIASIFLTFFQIVSFFSLPEFEFARVFIASIYFYFSISMICLTFLMDVENLTKAHRRFNSQLGRSGLEQQEELFKATRMLEVFWIVALSILVVFVIPYFITPKFLRTADYSVILMRKYVPYVEPFYIICLASFFVLSFAMCFSCILQYMYFSWHLQQQVLKLAERVKALGVIPEEDFVMIDRGDDLEGYYQRCIWMDLRFIIQRHILILNFHQDMITYLRVSITSLLIGISGIFLCFTGMWVAITEKQLRTGMLIPVCLIFVELLGFSAQSHENKFIVFYGLTLDVPWYQWDVKNRKAYLLFIRQAAQMVGYPFFNTRMNRAFQLQVLKAIYSTASVLMNVQN